MNLTDKMQASKIWLFLLMIFFSPVGQKVVQSQVVPDNTLGAESSIINSVDELRERIEGGATRKENLFHSFQEFNISEGLEVYFANPEGVANIFSRVTGSNISEILGTLGVEGAANLFFINPNGIVFGENVFVNVSGSFIATTANSIEFADGQTFSTRGDETKVTLTISAPIGLALYGNSGKIVVQGTGNNLLVTPDRLIVKDSNLPSAKTEISIGKSFALLGSEIKFEGGVLDVLAEKIEIGSVKKGKINFSLSPHLEFDYSQVEQFGDINLDNFSLIEINGDETIEANFQGNLIELENGSAILFVNSSNFPLNLSRRININAEEQLLFRGVTEDTPPTEEGLSRGVSGVTTQNFAVDAIDINIATKDLILESGGAIGNITVKNGLSGSINIDATNSVQISGSIPANPALAFSGIGSFSFEKADSSLININTKSLSFTNGGGIISTTFGSGRSGNINIQAKESVLVDGLLNNAPEGVVSSIGTNIFGSGISGNINVQTLDLFVVNGGVISASSFSDGSTGNIDVTATNSIIIDGFSGGRILENFGFSTIGSSVARIDPNLINQIPGLPTDPLPTGDAGSISLNTNNLTISNRGILGVQNDGIGDGGTIEINANNLKLDNEGNINAASASGLGGNITLNTEQLQLQNNSFISTSARGFGNGGNITIDTDTFTLLDNSQITAKAIEGNGGNISINTTGYFVSNDENISASSQFGIDGNVTINVLERDLDRSFLLPNYPLLSLSQALAKSCLTAEGRRDNALRINVLGKGGLPISPYSGLDEPEELTEVYIYSERDWQPGDPVLPVTTIIPTDDGRLLGASPVRVPKQCLL